MMVAIREQQPQGLNPPTSSRSPCTSENRPVRMAKRSSKHIARKKTIASRQILEVEDRANGMPFNVARKRRIDMLEAEDRKHDQEGRPELPVKRRCDDNDAAIRVIRPRLDLNYLNNEFVALEASVDVLPVRAERPKRALSSICNTHLMTTRRKSVEAARRGVLETAELLENVIVHLDLESIINTAGRVNWAWRNLISSSPMIRAKIFRFHEPERVPKDLAGDWAFDVETKVWVPVSGIEKVVPNIRDMSDWHRRQRAVRPTVLNPLLFQIDSSVPRPSITARATTCEDVYIRLVPNLQRLASGFQAMSKRSNYFGRMLICQPPVKTVEFYVIWEDKFIGPIEPPNDPGPFKFHRAERLKVDNPDGIRVHDIARGLLNIAKEEVGINKIRLLLSRGKKRSRLWLPGAVLLSEVEKAQVEEEARFYCSELTLAKTGSEVEQNLLWRM